MKLIVYTIKDFRVRRTTEVWMRVCNEGRFFITLDLDFSDVRQYSLGRMQGSF